MLGAIWKILAALGAIVADPFGFAIAHWPSLIVLAFFLSLPFAWSFWLRFFASPAGRIITVCIVVVALTWTLRGRFDDGEIVRLRADHRAELDAIKVANQAAQIEAQKQADKDAETNRKTLAAALIAAGQDKASSDAEAQRLRAKLRAVPRAVASKHVDPLLLEIIRGSR